MKYYDSRGSDGDSAGRPAAGEASRAAVLPAGLRRFIAWAISLVRDPVDPGISSYSNPIPAQAVDLLSISITSTALRMMRERAKAAAMANLQARGGGEEESEDWRTYTHEFDRE